MKLLPLFFFFSIFLKSYVQDNVGIKFFGLSIHPKGEEKNAHLMPNKLDKNAYLVMNLGAEVMYEKFVFKDVFSVKAIQGLYSDCATQLGGFTHLGVRGKIFKTEKHSLYGGFFRAWLPRFDERGSGRELQVITNTKKV